MNWHFARELALIVLASAFVLHPQPGMPAATPPATPPAAPVIEVVVLGSGTPVPSRTQAGAAILVTAGGHTLLFDCGRGCTTRLAQHDPRLLTRIDMLFLTHLHSDHIVGIPDLWLNGWTQGRRGPLQIWGPAGTSEMMEGLRRAYAADIGYRLGPAAPDPAPLRPKIHGLGGGGIVYRNGGLTITAFRVHHAEIPAYGYRIDYGGKSVLLSGDTTATPNLARYGKGVDVALMEVASPPMADYVRRRFPAAQAAEILALHLTAGQAAEALAAMRPGLGVYYHTVADCAAEQALRQETGKAYTGAVKVSQDLTTIRIFRDRIETDGALACGAE